MDGSLDSTTKDNRPSLLQILFCVFHFVFFTCC